METRYAQDGLNNFNESQDQKRQILVSNCIAGLTLCATELARGDPGGSANKVLRLRQHVAAIIGHWGMKDTYLGTFDEKVEAAKQGDELPAATMQQQLAAVHELYHYGMEMVSAHDRALKDSIKEIRDLMMETARHWNVLSPELIEMNNALTKELVLMEIPENRSIIFSHIALRGDNGAEASDFVSGPIYDSECVENTNTYQEFIADHPDVKNTEVCVNSYKIGCGESVYLSKEALELIRSAGEDFLNYEGMESYDWNLISVHNYDYYPDMEL